MNLQWQDLSHQALNVAQLYALLALRNQVFIVEQNCPYLDVDGADLAAENRHILGMFNDELVACARILSPAGAGEPVKIGRVIVSPAARGLHLGQQLMTRAIASCEQHWPQQVIFLSAQAHLQHFYSGFGFRAVSDVYPEDGIPHIDMQKG